MKNDFSQIIYDERGGLMPLWAIGGMMVVISIFWVENYSFAIMEKTREIRLASVVSRASIVERGNVTSNLERLVDATGVKINQNDPTISAQFRQATLENLQELKDKKRKSEIFSSRVNVGHEFTVPFEKVNQSIGIDPVMRMSATENPVKVLKPLNVILAIEASNQNKANVMQAKTALINSISRLYNEAPDTRTTIVPFSFRVNQEGKCYTGIMRSDEFSFSWWENFFSLEEYITQLEKQLKNEYEYLDSLKYRITYYIQMASIASDSREKHSPGTQEYKELTEAIEYYQSNINYYERMVPITEENIQQLKEKIADQKKVIEELKEDEQFVNYLPLAKHYANKFTNYTLLEDYTDSFANAGIFSIKENDFLTSADYFNKNADYLSYLSVKRNKYFGDTETCPVSSIKSNLVNTQSVNSILSSIDFSGNKIMTLEGLLWAGRTAFSRGMSRNVIIFFASDIKDAVDPDNISGVKESCAAITSEFINGKSVKLIIVTQSQKGREKFEKFNCATKWFSDKGYITLEDYDNDATLTLEDTFNSIFSQESATRNINKND